MNLHALTVQVIRENGTVEPKLLAKILVDRIPVKDRPDAMRQMARHYVALLLREERAFRAPSAASGGSRKIRDAAVAWQRVLNSPEYVPSAGTWIHLRDATREQVLEMAASRTAKAEANLVVAAKYERLAEAMETQGAAVVADLEESLLADLLGTSEAAA
jgi:voltage-gated potassium channel Kch